MERVLAAAALLGMTLLWGCGTRMVWQGPPGASQQDLADVGSSCNQRAESWRSYNAQVYQQTALENQVNGQQGAPNYLYRTADEMFQQCMVAQGYKLVPRPQ